MLDYTLVKDKGIQLTNPFKFVIASHAVSLKSISVL